MNQLNIFFEFGVSDAIIPNFSLKCNNLSINFCPTYIFYYKTVEFFTAFRRKFSNVISGSQKAENYFQVCATPSLPCRKSFISRTRVLMIAEDSWPMPGMTEDKSMNVEDFMPNYQYTI